MRRYLTEQQQRQLLNAAKRTADPLAQRDYHWMSALVLTGMRIEEWSLVSAPLTRLALEVGWLVSPKEHCKGKRRANEYIVTLPLRKHLQALLDLSDAEALSIELQEGQLQPLVWGRADAEGHAGALSVRSYEARMKVWAAAAGLDRRLSPHWLRHTRGMNVMRRTRGKDAQRVAQLALNHTSLRSTGIYTQMSREEFEASIRMVDGGRMSRSAARAMVERST